MNSLAAIATTNGRLAVLAMDQRATLRRMLTEAGRPAADDDMIAFKLDVVGALSPASSGVLLDLEYGVQPARQAGALADEVGVLIAAEPATKRKVDGEYHTFIEDDKNAAWVRDSGGDALKFLVQWDPDRVTSGTGTDPAQMALDVVGGIVADCAAIGVPSVIEPLVSVAPGRELTKEHQEAAVVRSAVRMAELGMDLLKIEWPGGPAACASVSDQLGPVPWALLSAGVAYDAFVERTTIALDNGACGFIAGRAIWGEAVAMDGPQRRAWLGDVARTRLDRLSALLETHGRSWQEVRG